MNNMPYSLVPLHTPQALKVLIITTFVLSIGGALVESLLYPALDAIGFSVAGPEWLFGLSRYGLNQLWLWQPFTYPFIYISGTQALSYSMLINLAFQMYLLWVMGSEVIERIQETPFVISYLFLGAFSGMVALLVTPYRYSYYPLIGPEACLLGLFTLWTMVGPEREVMLFFLFSIKVNKLFGIIGSAIILVTITQGIWWQLFYYGSAVIAAYLIGLIYFDLPSPYRQLFFVDRQITKLKPLFFSILSRVIKKKKKNVAINDFKVIDIMTGEPVYRDDEEFVDAMLAKIAQNGERSLSTKEKKRLDAIATKRRKSTKS